MKKILIVLGGIIVLAIAASALDGGGTDESEPSTPAAQSEAGSDDQPTDSRESITYAEIVARSDAMTDAQWEAFADELEDGYRAEEWSGFVHDVREQVLGDGYYVQLDIEQDDDFALHEFNIDVPQDVALSLSKGDAVTATGDIKRADRALDRVTIELAEGALTR